MLLFHQYIFSKETIVERITEKPLVSIYAKPLINSILSLQHMLIKLQLYELEIKYKPGHELHIADSLSRNFLNNVLSEIKAQINLNETFSNY